MESILSSVKKRIGIEPEYEIYDVDIIDNINSTFSILNQLGVGPKNGFMIESSKEIWTDYVPIGQLQNLIRQYVFLRVKRIFDPTSSGNVAEAMNSEINELEWRIQEEVEILKQSNTEGGVE